MLIVGLTGGIASGKSTITALFNAHGVGHVDADIVARDIVAPGEPVLAQLIERYGTQLLLPSGELNRAALRTLIFESPEERRWVEALMHPAIRHRMFEQVAQLPAPYGLLVVPLLFETGLDQHVDRVLVIDVPESLQRARLKARDHSSNAQIDAILDAQLSRTERLARADDVIDNQGSLDDPALAQRIAALDSSYRQYAEHKRR